MHLIIGLLLSSAIGVSLGLIGGGGSIITVPVLVYVLGVDAHEAVAMSLAVVGATSIVGAWLHSRRGVVRVRTGLLFASTGIAGALGGGAGATVIGSVGCAVSRRATSAFDIFSAMASEPAATK